MNPSDEIKVTYIGGPTAILELGGWRMITDPTLDPADTDYVTPHYTLHKSQSPRIWPGSLGHIDRVLLSHDHHFDNLDHGGRKLLGEVDGIYTTVAAAERLGPSAEGLEPWRTVSLPEREGRVLEITGTPCRHGPEGGDRGPVTGFLLQYRGTQTGGVYVTGDTVWYEGVSEVAQKFRVGLVLAFMGAARVPEVGPDALTMTAPEGVMLAGTFPEAMIVPLHYEGWNHFSDSRSRITDAFREAGLSGRLRWPDALGK
jgi:L-ascorbate metabolism protein UlaG (beta-lactamase superfamily)